MESLNNRAFLLAMAAVPLACGPSVVAAVDDGTTSDGTGSTGSMSSATTGTMSSTGPDATTDPTLGSSSGGVETSTTGVETSTTGGSEPGTTTGGSSESGDGSSGSAGSSSGTESSSTGEPQALCDAWGEVFYDCYNGYTLEYLVETCEYYAADMVCPKETLALLECQAFGGQFCGGGCFDFFEAQQACEDAAEAEERGCADIPVNTPEGVLEASCFATAQQALDCDAMGVYIGGFSPYTYYDDALEGMQAHCMAGAYWTFPGPDPQSSCGGAYEDLLACISGLDCDAFGEVVYGGTFSQDCEQELVALECKCDLGVN